MLPSESSAYSLCLGEYWDLWEKSYASGKAIASTLGKWPSMINLSECIKILHVTFDLWKFLWFFPGHQIAIRLVESFAVLTSQFNRFDTFLSSFILLYLLIPKDFLSDLNVYLSQDLIHGTLPETCINWVGYIPAVMISLNYGHYYFWFTLFTMISVESIFKYLLNVSNNVIFCWSLHQNSSKTPITLRIKEYEYPSLEWKQAYYI